MRTTLKKKYILTGILLIIGFLAFLFLSAAVFQNKLMDEWNNEEIESVADKILEELDKSGWDLNQTEIEVLAFENNVSVTIADEDYKVLYSTRYREKYRKLLGKTSIKVIEDTKKKLEKTGKSFVSNFDDEKRASFIYIQKIRGNDYLVIRRSVEGFKSSIYVLERCFVIAALLTLFCGIVVILILTGRMTRPICEINRVTAQIANLNFDEKAEVHSGDEFGELAASVNLMSDKLKEAVGSLHIDLEKRKNLVRNMSHELKTPVAVIMGYAENLEYIAQKHPQKIGKYCEVISKECERMDELISQMLEVSASESGVSVLNLTEISPEELLKAVRNNYEIELEEHKGRYIEENELTADFVGDWDVLQRALYNLIKNAVRYGEKEGKIITHLWEDDICIHFNVYNDGSHISEEIQDRIWDEFYKADNSRKRERGSFGIGLSIVKQAALAHGGGVEVRNTSDGVIVGFYIPIKRK
ncbi:MAG: HAMP domain-containing sensor histidine kinase [Eubacteriales bacterium]|nr:HAMP domain-containing sensor histidine kinase [Eubacteriales bacterium]